MAVIMALNGCYCNNIESVNQRRPLDNLCFTSSISAHKLSKNERSASNKSGNDKFPRFVVEMRQTEVPPSKYGTNGRAVKMVPATELVKRKTASENKAETVNGSKQVVNGASLVRRDPTPTLTKTTKPETSKELPPLEELKVLPSDEGLSWANENYNSWQRSIDVWSFVLSLRVRVLLDNAKWAYVGGFTEEKQVGSGSYYLDFNHSCFK
jgi:disease resistance protein RPM1